MTEEQLHNGSQAVHRSGVSFEALGGGEVLLTRFRNSAMIINASALILLDVLLTLINPGRGLLAIIIPPAFYLLILPIVNLSMRRAVRKHNKELMDMLNSKGELQLTDSQFTETANLLLRSPWVGILRGVGIWVFIATPIFCISDWQFGHPPTPTLYCVVTIGLWLPVIITVLLLRFEQICIPYVQTLFRSRGLTSVDSPLALTAKKRYLLLYGLTGPYLVSVYFILACVKITISGGKAGIEDLLPLNVFFLSFFVISWIASFLYMGRVFERPMKSMLRALRGQSDPSGGAERMDEWLIAYELLRQRDQSEERLRLSESRFRLLIQVMPVGAMVLNADDRLELINPAMEKLILRENSAEMGCPVWEVLGLSETQWREMNLSTRTTIEPIGITLPAERVGADDLERKHIEMSAQPFETESGHKFLLLIHDVTERKRMEKLKQEFFAIVSHELRTPLTSLRFFLSVTEQGRYGELSDAGKERTSGAINNLDRLIGLVQDILDAEKLESGEFECIPEKTRIETIVKLSVDAVKDLADEKQIEIKITMKDEELIVDEERICQVLVNLLSNALKFADGKPIELAVTASYSDVTFNIIDRGTGVPDDKKDLIFEKFKQVQNAQSKRKSTGLGLPIARAIVIQHGGTIGVKDTEGGGTTFWFTIPKAMPVP